MAVITHTDPAQVHSHSPILLGIAFVALIAALTAFGRRLPVPAPVLQVLAGLALGFLPDVTVPELEPDLVFFVFLPPILWAAAYFTSLREFKANRRPIALLAVGLVVATTLGVAWVARALFPGMPWAVAVALGAIVSPPDAVAAAAVVSRLPVPRRVIVILEGESLVNDASALVLYRSAVVAAVTGVFSLGASIVRFFVDAGVGTLVGLLAGWLFIRAARRTRDELVETLLLLAAPYAVDDRRDARLRGAGVRGWWTVRATSVHRHHAQIPSAVEHGVEVLIFVLNAMIFVLLGIQFATLSAHQRARRIAALSRAGLIISLVVIVVRLVWVPIVGYMPRVLDRDLACREPVSPKSVMLVAGRACAASCRWPRPWRCRSRWPMAAPSRSARRCCM